jgi:glutamate racemase
LLQHNIDTLVLGCTHYPLLKPILRTLLGDDVTLVDSAAETAMNVREVLHHDGLLRQSPPAPPRFFVTDLPTRFEQVGGSFLGDLLSNVQQVEID